MLSLAQGPITANHTDGISHYSHIRASTAFAAVCVVAMALAISSTPVAASAWWQRVYKNKQNKTHNTPVATATEVVVLEWRDATMVSDSDDVSFPSLAKRARR